MNYAQREFYENRELYENTLNNTTPGSMAYRKWVAFIKAAGFQVLRHKTTGKHKIVPPKK